MGRRKYQKRSIGGVSFMTKPQFFQERFWRYLSSQCNVTVTLPLHYMQRYHALHNLWNSGLSTGYPQVTNNLLTGYPQGECNVTVTLPLHYRCITVYVTLLLYNIVYINTRSMWKKTPLFLFLHRLLRACREINPQKWFKKTWLEPNPASPASFSSIQPKFRAVGGPYG